MTTAPAQPLDNPTVSAFGGKVSKSVVFAIHDASQKSGVDFSYLVKQAAVESSFNPTAKAKGSSATGLYQFIESTWLDMVHKHGEKYGIDPSSSRKELLALRKDPELSSYMAAELANENEQFLKDNWGGDVGETELYLAHFMGAGGAASFLKAKDKSPMMAAADLFPEAARSNRSVFFDGHRARSVGEVYSLFDKKFDRFESGVEELAALIPQDSSNNRSAQDAVQTAALMPAADQAEAPLILPATSVVFSMRPQYASAEQKTANAAAYQQMVMNPVELMMLSQLDTPSGEKTSRFF
jgi:hypothetical protein